jgi:2-hydroxy-3-keto-5-methylthiopentenyl-1-phosphate phosphatase
MKNPGITLNDQLKYLKPSFLRKNSEAFAKQAAQKKWSRLEFLGRLIEGRSYRTKDQVET